MGRHLNDNCISKIKVQNAFSQSRDPSMSFFFQQDSPRELIFRRKCRAVLKKKCDHKKIILGARASPRPWHTARGALVLKVIGGQPASFHKLFSPNASD